MNYDRCLSLQARFKTSFANIQALLVSIHIGSDYRPWGLDLEEERDDGLRIFDNLCAA